MTLQTGDKLPEGKVKKMGAEGPEEVTLHSLLAGKKIALFVSLEPLRQAATKLISLAMSQMQTVSKIRDSTISFVLRSMTYMSWTLGATLQGQPVKSPWSRTEVRN